MYFHNLCHLFVKNLTKTQRKKEDHANSRLLTEIYTVVRVLDSGKWQMIYLKNTTSGLEGFNTMFLLCIVEEKRYPDEKTTTEHNSGSKALDTQCHAGKQIVDKNRTERHRAW